MLPQKNKKLSAQFEGPTGSNSVVLVLSGNLEQFLKGTANPNTFEMKYGTVTQGRGPVKIYWAGR